MPAIVARALASSSLLLLGFQADDWDFRVLFSSILRQNGNALQREGVSIQMNPDEGRVIHPARTYRYLNRFFKQAHLDVFWGSTEEFLAQLLEAIPVQSPEVEAKPSSIPRRSEA